MGGGEAWLQVSISDLVCVPLACWSVWWILISSGWWQGVEFRGHLRQWWAGWKWLSAVMLSPWTVLPSLLSCVPFCWSTGGTVSPSSQLRTSPGRFLHPFSCCWRAVCPLTAVQEGAMRRAIAVEKSLVEGTMGLVAWSCVCWWCAWFF